MTSRLLREAMPELSLFAPPAPVPQPECPPLTEIFGMISEQWARDFLFKCDASGDLTALTSPAQLQHAMANEFSASFFDTAGTFGGLFNHQVNVSLLLVPVFSVGAVSAEVVLQLAKKQSNDGWGMPHTDRTFARMLRNDETGDLLMATDDASIQQTSLTYFRADGTTTRSRVYILAHRELFHAAMFEGEIIDVARAARAISLIAHAREFRACPQCGAPAAAMKSRSCGCTFSLRRARHPLDYSCCRTNMVVHSGSFCGTADATILSGGATIATAAHLIVQSDAITITHPAEVQRLCERIAKIRMMQLAVVPLALRERRFIAAPGAGTHPAMRALFGNQQRADSNPFSTLSISESDAWFTDQLGNDATTANDFLLGEPEQKDTSKVASMDGSVSSTALSFTSPFLDEPTGFLDPMVASESLAGNTRGNGSVFTALCDTAPANTSNTIPSCLPEASSTLNAVAVDRHLQRQIKNREAAARSNLRRKLKNDTLKRNLKEAQQKENELREIEAKLKEENMRLKDQLHRCQ